MELVCFKRIKIKIDSYERRNLMKNANANPFDFNSKRENEFILVQVFIVLNRLKFMVELKKLDSTFKIRETNVHMPIKNMYMYISIKLAITNFLTND